MHTLSSLPAIPTGKINTFGPFGPKYEIGQPLHQLDDGDWLVEITIVDTGEKSQYRLSRLSNDPRAL